MVEAVFIIILSFFAVYGILQLIAKGLFSARASEDGGSVFVHRIIGVRNCEESIEGMIRSLVWEDIREELIVVDLGSDDATREILSRLEAEYEFLHVMPPGEYESYLGMMLSGYLE